jgi:hypothetical protein
LPVPVILAFLSLATPAVGSPLERFFIGTTQGSGSVEVIVSGRHGMRDRTRGRMDAGGALLLDQIVEEDGKPARRRTWRLVRSGGNHISGTISDVRGAVAGEIAETALHLRYRLEEGPYVEQWIALQPGGRTARNRMIFHRFGLKVATVESEIRKVD